MVLNLLDKNTILFYNEADKFKDCCGRGRMYLWGKKILENGNYWMTFLRNPYKIGNAYKVLKYMYFCQIKLPDGTEYIPLSQAEMAPLIGVSTITINKLFKQLRDDNLLLPIQGKRGKYELTEKAIIIIKDMEKLEDKIRRDRINGSI